MKFKTKKERFDKMKIKISLKLLFWLPIENQKFDFD